ncbi:MAG: hypothetical protein WD231_01015 [Candidatus Woykebacteria bacterium]
MKYSFTCNQGHEPVTFTAEADSDDEALQKIMEQAGPHAAEVHPDMANKSPEEMKQMITGSWTKE